MPTDQRHPTIGAILVSRRFWLFFAWTLAARVFVDTMDDRPLKWPWIAGGSFALALFGVWLWDRVVKQKA